MKRFTVFVLSAFGLAIYWCEATPQFGQLPSPDLSNNPIASGISNGINFFQSMFNNMMQGIPNMMAMFTGARPNDPNTNSSPGNSGTPSEIPAILMPPARGSDPDIDEFDPRDLPKNRDVEVFDNGIEPFNE